VHLPLIAWGARVMLISSWHAAAWASGRVVGFICSTATAGTGMLLDNIDACMMI